MSSHHSLCRRYPDSLDRRGHQGRRALHNGYMSANQMQRMRSILFVDKRMDFRRSPPRERPMACFFSSFFSPAVARMGSLAFGLAILICLVWYFFPPTKQVAGVVGQPVEVFTQYRKLDNSGLKSLIASQAAAMREFEREYDERRSEVINKNQAQNPSRKFKKVFCNWKRKFPV
jgi:hypothetical protein